MAAEIRICLVRHGQSEWNAAGRLQGQTAHVALTELGRRQAAVVADRLADQSMDLLLTSDLLRARQTAEAVAHATGLPMHADRRLREQGYGRLEGRRIADIEVDLTDPTARIGGGESLDDVYRRVGVLLGACLAAARRHTLSGVVLVTHGETIRAAIAWLTGRDSRRAPKVLPPNGSITVVRLTADGGTLAGVDGETAVWCDATDSDGSAGSRCESDAVPPL